MREQDSGCGDLQDNVEDDDEEGEGEVDEQPYLHRFDSQRAGESRGDGEVDGGQHHHAGSGQIKIKIEQNRAEDRVSHMLMV